MLDGQIKEWPLGINMASPNGLYLAKFEYEPEALMGSSENLADLPIAPSDLEREPIQWDKFGPIMKSLYDSKGVMIRDKKETVRDSEESVESSEEPVIDLETPLETSKSLNDIT